MAQLVKTVTVGAAERATVYDHVAVVGTLIAKEEMRVNALIEGKEIRQILVEAGDVVRKGQPLALLDVAQAELLLERNTVQLSRVAVAVAQENSRIDVASVTERETRKAVERSRSLFGKGVVSQQLLDEHENAFSRAKSQLEMAQQALTLAEADRKLVELERSEIALTIERSTVRATASGLILIRNARVGSVTSPSGDPLFSMAQDSLVEVEASVSEASFIRLKEGMGAEIIVPGRTGPIHGRVRLSAARIDPGTRMGLVRVELVQGQGLVPGAFVYGRIETGQRSNVVVPATAVRSQDGKSSVFVVENDLVRARSVTLGSPAGSTIELLSGVKDGEIVVIRSGSFLKAGEKILAVRSTDPEADKLSFLKIDGGAAR
ncbi:HlyD family secretion protein [Rhizobium sp. PP-F2F-G38]|nr:HlyD family secretion protein [Rhizobium sp. PP-WC-1G-195]PYE93297.1 HlyD family secretion protein [Rhizobium sp. PP-F2F-G38]TCL89407.1 HlyD family secretion protein [Rhizobium sp. PP-WC-2G-219]TCP77795.1 HlyD family secretion protein [Rhizobium sp. PP-CC-2G-626]